MSSPDGLHIIDTCSLVNIRDLDRDSSRIWDALCEQIEGGRLKTVRQVCDELERRFPDVYRRLKPQKKILLIPDAELYALETITEIRAIQRAHPKLYNQFGTGNPADPFLIAAAKIQSGIVVTDERTAGKKHKEKIPYVCAGRNVGCTSRVQYLKVLGIDVDKI
ncbi:DUF4411 family protein [Mesorhizobium sp. M0118]|uniref:DUF4411 family protein n=1 Tax=Mesorhizobium sp. M0118 TaxID=2956884 RepID=UPI00333568A8